MKNKNINLYEALQKSGADVDEKQKAFLDTLSTVIGKALEETDVTLSQALKDALGEAEKDKDGNVIPMAKQLADIAVALEKMEKQTAGEMMDKDKFRLKSYVEKNHKAICEAIKNGTEMPEFEFSAMKAPAAFYNTPSVITNGSGVNLPLVENYVVEDDIARIRYPENFILEVIPNTQVDRVPQQVIRMEEGTEEGTVAITAEGAIKPLQSNTFVRTVTNRNKWAGRIEWSEEFEMDHQALFDAIVQMFEQKVIRAWQNGLIDIIETNAIAYTSSALDDTLIAPDNGLAVVAGQSSIQSLNYTPNTVIMNPADLVAVMFQQDANGNLKISPYINVTTGTINGMRLFASNTITPGTALVGDSTVYREWHSGFIFRVGTYNDQFIRNLKTAIGEVFTILRVANIDKKAFMLLDLDAVKAALQKPEA